MTEITPANARAPSPQDHSQDLSVISASLSTTSETRKRQRRREGNSAVSVSSWWVSVPHRCSTSQVDRGRDKVTSQRRLTRRLPRCTRSLNMCKTEASKDCQTDWAHVGALDDEHVDLPDVPEVTDAHMDRTTLRVGGKSVPRRKERFNVYLDVATWPRWWTASWTRAAKSVSMCIWMLPLLPISKPKQAGGVTKHSSASAQTERLWARPGGHLAPRHLRRDSHNRLIRPTNAVCQSRVPQSNRPALPLNPELSRRAS